jgi:hypothetical protein
MTATRRRLVVFGLAIGFSGLAVAGYAGSKLNFDGVDLGLVIGWAGIAIIALAIAGPPRYTIRSIMLAAVLLALLLGIIFRSS